MQVYNTQGSSGLVESYSRIRTWAKQGNKQGNVFFFQFKLQLLVSTITVVSKWY